MPGTETTSVEVHFDFLNEVEAGSGVKVSGCYQCRKCTNGCPVTFAMDLYPDQIIRSIQLGMKEAVLNSHTPWICASCETCATRCPNQIDTARVMDFLKQQALKQGIRPKESGVLAFHRVFLEDIRKRGRVFEAGLMQAYLLKSGQWLEKLKDRSLLEEMKLGWTLYRKGRLALLPKGIQAKKEVKALLEPSGRKGARP